MKHTSRLTSLSDHALCKLVRSDDEGAKEELIRRHHRLVYLFLQKHPGYYRAAEDYIQEGMLALLRAATRYDSSRGKFSTYAMHWIHQYIGRAMSRCERLIAVPKSFNQQDIEEKAPDALLIWDSHRSNGRRFVETIADEANTTEALDGIIDAHTLAGIALEGLSPKYREVIVLKYGFNGQCGETLNFQQIGDRLGITREAVRTRHKRALNHMKRTLIKSGGNK
jgi:RNA polymerase sigma factor (sigma-70 family)